MDELVRDIINGLSDVLDGDEPPRFGGLETDLARYPSVDVIDGEPGTIGVKNSDGEIFFIEVTPA